MSIYENICMIIIYTFTKCFQKNHPLLNLFEKVKTKLLSTAFLRCYFWLAESRHSYRVFVTGWCKNAV